MPKISLTPFEPRAIVGMLGVVRMTSENLAALVVKTHADPDLALLCMQMFYVLLALDQREFALEMQARALTLRRGYRLAGPAAPTVRLLAFMAPGDMLDNTPFEFLVENSDVRLDLLYLLPDQALPDEVPQHDVAIVAIGESDKHRALLARVQAWLTDWPRPVLNAPPGITRCARDTAYALLHDIPGLFMPLTQRLKRGQVGSARFPITVRPVDTQGGNGLEKVAAESELDAYFERHPGTDYFVAEFVPYQGRDGLFRKFRIALIDGQPFVCHLAISAHWMVHYRSAGMELSASKRREEASLMENFDSDFALRHGAALSAIAARLGLDYVVLDCAQTQDGRLLLFEVDSRGWIHSTDPVEVFPYKPAVMQKAYAAFRAMLGRHAAQGRATRAGH
jgi:glutathione synthase/RimK-type ligase-like ATP-grasp enzyme